MKSNKHLSLEERSRISVLQSSGESVRSIARILGRSPSTISRKLNRPQADKFRGNYIASTTHRIDISLRDKLSNKRKEFGHFEADSIESCKQRGKTLPCLTVVVERVYRFVSIRKTASKTANATTKSIISAFKPFKNNVISITYDNGCEFSQYEKINNLLNTKSYFARQYCSNDKGTVENINGLIRRFFPKGTNFDNISEKTIAYVEDGINNRPMKILNCMTSKQIF